MGRVTLIDVTRDYAGGVRAVDRLSLDIREGELLVLVGPSGCGKSTTLRLIAGLDDPSAGSIHIAGRDVTGAPPRDRDVAMVFQNNALYPHLSVSDNLAFGLRMRRRELSLDDGDVERRVREAAATLGIEALLQRRPHELSGGQRQRVALGRAIVRRPKAFLFDEPLSNLDAGLRTAMRGEIKRLQRQTGVTTIHVTHDQAEAMALGDRVAVLRDGALQQVAPPMDVYRRPANRFVAGFIGSPPMNVLEGSIRRGGNGLEFDVGNMRLPLPPEQAIALAAYVDQPLTLGIRPHAISLHAPPGLSIGIAARVESVAMMGPECECTMAMEGGSRMTACAGDSPTFSAGQHVSICIDWLQAHWFRPGLGEERVTFGVE